MNMVDKFIHNHTEIHHNESNEIIEKCPRGLHALHFYLKNVSFIHMYVICFALFFQLLQSLKDNNGEKDEKDAEKTENMNKENKLNVPLGIKTSSLKYKRLLSPLFFHFKRVKKSQAQNERSVSFLLLFL